MQLSILPAARTDLKDIGDYIAADSPVRARTFVAEIEAFIVGDLAHRPASFPGRPDLASGLRMARWGRYLIFFTHDVETVEIVRVLHGARDLPRVFEG